jgi:hypothetical protein
MAASSVGPTNHKIKLVQLGDASDIQVALNNVVYGTDTTPAGTGSISADSLYGNLANKVSPTFTGTVTLPNTTRIMASNGTDELITSTELSYLDGVTSAVQTQLNNIPKTDSFWYGDGSDGTVVITSGTTTLTRDMYYANLSISGTGRLNPNGFRVFVAGYLQLAFAPEGAISYIANPGGNALTNEPGAGGVGASSTTSYYGRSTSGAAGAAGSGTGTGVAGNSVTANSPILQGNWIASIGGISTGTTGDDAQTATTASTTAIGWRRSFVDLSAPFITGTLYCGAGGNGGNAGAPVSPFAGGAGGGGGAGNIGCFIYAKEIRIGSSTADSAIKFVGGAGGNGDNGDPDGEGSSRGGGGGGGQGGMVYLVYSTVTGSMTSGRFLINSSGGDGGTGYRGGQGGASGSIAMTNLTTGAITINAATAGATTSTSTGGAGHSRKVNLA